MSIDGKLLARARKTLEDKRRQKAALLDKRTEQVFNASPRIMELDYELRSTMSELVGIALGTDNSKKVEDIQARNKKLQTELRSELVKAGYPQNYLDNEYMCKECRDTGYVELKMCQCLNKLYKAEQKASLSNLLKLGNERFNNFNLSFYSDIPSKDTGTSHRSSMETVYNICVKYAKTFNSKSMNLFFNGGTGLGKTFLSACIAWEVAAKGYSVVYDTACAVFAKYEDARFSKLDDPEETRDEIKRYLNCDFLIIDDLGTEMTTTLTISALYEIINTRLCASRKTLINSNLTLDEMRMRYSEQIMSRLEGEYLVLRFYGEDIRRKLSKLN